MAERTGIAWTGATWTPIRARHRVTGKVGWYCQRISEGCRHCYAATMNGWRGNGVDYTVPALTDVELFLDERILAAPLRWRTPRRIFVCSMTDLFGAWMPDEWIDRIFAVMVCSSQHTFQILTKRPERMVTYFRDVVNRHEAKAAWVRQEVARAWLPHEPAPAPEDDRFLWPPDWPMRNVWLGVPVEEQATADARIPLLPQTPAAVRWVSYEPALASVDFSRWVFDRKAEVNRLINGPAMLNRDQAEASVSYPLDWLVVGGESGRDARPPHPDWFRSARNQCGAVGVPFFFKQWGEWREHPEPPLHGYNNGAGLYVLPNGRLGFQGDYWSGAAAGMDKVGKKTAGDLLDGQEWKEWPR